MRAILPKAIAGVILLGILSVVLGSWYTIDEGERGVVLRYGAVSGVAQPGLGFKIPVIDLSYEYRCNPKLRSITAWKPIAATSNQPR